MTKLSEEARLARNEYYRKWRKDNPEKALAIQERYWKKKLREIETKKKCEEKKQIDDDEYCERLRILFETGKDPYDEDEPF